LVTIIALALIIGMGFASERLPDSVVRTVGSCLVLLAFSVYVWDLKKRGMSTLAALRFSLLLFGTLAIVVYFINR